MRRSRFCFILSLLLLAAAGAYAEQPPKELMQYLRDARKAGLNESQIQQNAVKAGWAEAIVTEAIHSLGPSPSSSPLGDSSKAPGSPGTVPPTVKPASPSEGNNKPAASDAPPPVKPAGPSESNNKPATVEAPPQPDPSVKTPAATNRGVPDDYVIGEGDVLHISVWKEPDASVSSAVVRPDGKISMPMLKEVQVSGLTPIQVEKIITEQLDKFISAADVTVIVSAINSKKIYIVGGVKKEGPLPYNYRMTVLQAISEAGGLTDYAKKKKIYVLRHESGREYQLPFDYDAALKGQRMDLNYVLMPGDTLVVPK